MPQSFWSTPAGRAGLAARSMDRLALNQATAESPWPAPIDVAHAEAAKQRRVREGAFEEVALDWCDHHGGYVEPGTTRPYTDDKRLRACAGCIEAMRAEVLARETYHDECGYLSALHLGGHCPSETTARKLTGDR